MDECMAVSLETSGYFPQMPRDDDGGYQCAHHIIGCMPDPCLTSFLPACRISEGFKSKWGMDLTMTYELKSDIPTTFFSNIFLNATAEVPRLHLI
jgi:hypothetical protein